MLDGTGANAPQFSRVSPPIDAPLSREAGTYLSTGDLPENDNCSFQGSAQRSVTIPHTSDLLATADPARQDSEGNTLLCLAAQAGNLVEAQQQILRGADVHHVNLDGDNALTLAAAGGHLTFIRWLDSHCPQPVNHQNYYAQTALILAARHGHQPVVQWLVSRDASLTHFNDQLKDALAEAVANGHLTLAQWLSFQDTDLSRVYPDGNNLFLHAVSAGHQSMAQWLEDSGVNSQQINESGDSAVTLAARHGYHQLLAWLLRKNAAGIHRICRNGDSPLLMAARHGHGQTAKLLLQHGADTGVVNYAGSSVLTLAAASSESLALCLCKASINIHQIDLSGNNAFTLAAQSGFFQLMKALEQLGINIHQVNHNNDNAFTLVARQGSLPWCQWLAGKGINIHQVNRRHDNAFTLAALAGSLPLLQWLFTEDIDWQHTPRTPSYENNHAACAIFLSYSFNAAILAASAGHFTQAQWLMRKGLSIHQRDYFSRNAIIQAVRLGRLDAVKWFITQGIMPDEFPDGFPNCFKTSNYDTISLAAHLGHLHILQWLHQNGGSLDDHSDARNLLLLAVRRGDLPMTQWLCRQGIDIHRFDSIGSNSALSVAIRCGYLRLSQWLVGQGAGDTPDFNVIDALTWIVRSGHDPIFKWFIRSHSLDDQLANKLLLRALSEGHRSLAVWLCLNVCKTISGTDSENRSAFMLAAMNGFLWLTKRLSEQALDINQACPRGYTALMLAAGNGHLPVVQWLHLEKNASLHQKAADGTDALHLAIIRGETETANWLIGQGMVLNPNYFTEDTVRWISGSNNVGLLQCLLRQQLSPELLVTAMLDAAYNADVPALACCFSAGLSPQFTNDRDKSCFTEAAHRGSLATLEFLCHYLVCDVNNEKMSALKTAASYGNLHIIQWFWERRKLSQHEQNLCLFTASTEDHFHVVKWLHRQGVHIGAKTVDGRSSLSSAVVVGNVPMLEWFCHQGEDLFQVKADGKGALSLAIEASEPEVARWLFRRGFQLTKGDLDYIFPDSRHRVLIMIFRMTSRIRRANLFHSSFLNQKLRLLIGLGCNRDNGDLIEEANTSFARFNQYNDKTLEHKCLVTLANLIGQQSGTLKAGLKVVDSLPIPSDCKFNLQELITINLENVKSQAAGHLGTQSLAGKS